MFASRRVQFTKDVVKKKKWIQPATRLDQFVTSETKGECEGALFALGRLSSSVSAVQLQSNVIALGSDGGIPPVDVIFETLVKGVM
jgi:hypothetical protein